MKFADVEKLQRYDLAGAAPGSSLGAVEARQYSRGHYELHARGPVGMKIAPKGTDLNVTDLIVDPSTRPFAFVLKRDATILLAAASSTQTQAWLIPLVDE